VNALLQEVSEGVCSTCAISGDGKSLNGSSVLGAFCICFLCFFLFLLFLWQFALFVRSTWSLFFSPECDLHPIQAKFYVNVETSFYWLGFFVTDVCDGLNLS
jgi:hypothetical protein